MGKMITEKDLIKEIRMKIRKREPLSFLGFVENKDLSKEVEAYFELYNGAGIKCGYDWVNGNEKLKKLIKKIKEEEKLKETLKQIKKTGYILKEDFLKNTKPVEIFGVIETILNYLKELDRYKDLVVLDNDKWIIAERIYHNWRD